MKILYVGSLVYLGLFLGGHAALSLYGAWTVGATAATAAEGAAAAAEAAAAEAAAEAAATTTVEAGAEWSAAQYYAVIGRGAAGRVIPYAESIGAYFYEPCAETLAEGEAALLEENLYWILSLIKSGATFIDIGAGGIEGYSFFYEMELYMLLEYGSPVITIF